MKYNEVIFFNLLVCPNITLNETTGVISSPFYPRFYPDNQACSWTLTAELGKHIRLIIEPFNIQQCGSFGVCACDYLQVQNGFTADGATNRRICGVESSITYFSFGDSLTVLFVSDGSRSKQYDGFRASYSQVNSTPSCKYTNVCKDFDRAHGKCFFSVIGRILYWSSS